MPRARQIIVQRSFCSMSLRRSRPRYRSAGAKAGGGHARHRVVLLRTDDPEGRAFASAVGLAFIVKPFGASISRPLQLCVMIRSIGDRYLLIEAGASTRSSTALAEQASAGRGSRREILVELGLASSDDVERPWSSAAHACDNDAPAPVVHAC